MPSSFTAQEFRAALGQFATGIAIATTLDRQGKPVGLTINSFASVSLDPPLVLWCIGSHSSSRPAFDDCRTFAVSVLSAAQVDLANRFAASGEDRFAGVDWSPGLEGVPLIDGCCARFECSVDSRHAGGDHLILIGRAERVFRDPRPPLLYHASQYQRLAELPSAPDVVRVPM
jgi:flavin reductase (DIM6/NTAB) family NADH-FMN oxidoreductase RutF